MSRGFGQPDLASEFSYGRRVITGQDFHVDAEVVEGRNQVSRPVPGVVVNEGHQRNAVLAFHEKTCSVTLDLSL